MKNTLSSNYLLNRYSYFIYFIFTSYFIVRMKTNGWILEIEDMKIFAIGTLFYFLWIFAYGTFHFKEQAKVMRVDYETLKFVKGRKTREIKKTDIGKIYIQKVSGVKTGNHQWYKVLVITKGNEKYRFTYIANSLSLSANDLIENFLQKTNNFWGLADKNEISLSPSFLFCN